jgi:hypothetical protein
VIVAVSKVASASSGEGLGTLVVVGASAPDLLAGTGVPFAAFPLGPPAVGASVFAPFLSRAGRAFLALPFSRGSPGSPGLRPPRFLAAGLRVETRSAAAAAPSPSAGDFGGPAGLPASAVVVRIGASAGRGPDPGEALI